MGQNLGAGQPERAMKSVMQTMKYNIIFMAIVSALFFFIGQWLVGVFLAVPIAEALLTLIACLLFRKGK